MQEFSYKWICDQTNAIQIQVSREPLLCQIWILKIYIFGCGRVGDKNMYCPFKSQDHDIQKV